MLFSRLVVGLVGLASNVFAAKCSAIPATGCFSCGRVVNNTPWTLRITQNPAPYGSGVDKAHPDLCDIFNWEKLKRGVRCPDKKPCKCDQETVAPGTSRGGNSCNKDESKRTDVDAITFADRDWYFYPYWEGGKVWHKAVKGTWLKISSTDRAECDEKRFPYLWSSKVPVCHILLRP